MTIHTSRLHLLVALCLSAFVSVGAAQEPSTGEAIYRQQCASCHGKNGEGSDEYPKALEGKKTLDALTQLVVKRMPKETPEDCVGEDAERVTKYLYDEFYSAEAQQRKTMPRIELARLTVTQHQNLMAALLGAFRPDPPDEQRHGLQGDYQRSSRFSRRGRVLERIDPTVDVDFGTGSLDSRINAEEFGIRWEGAVYAPTTGDYEFAFESANGARLWINDLETPLIDAWVRSGKVNRESGSLRLLGGRRYALRLEFFKSKQAKEKTASIRLLWKRPLGVEEVVPTRYLSPTRVHEVFVLQTSFPPDDRSRGWERGTITKEWDAATTSAALETASYVEAHLAELIGTRLDAADGPKRLREFCHKFVETAFRHPLSEAEHEFFVERQLASTPKPSEGVKRVVLLALKSPRFLYVQSGATPNDVASRLALAVWDSLPDGPLLDAAKSNQLATREEVVAQAKRMLQDPRARTKLRAFLHHWLGLDESHNLAKDPKRYPEFDAAVVADLAMSLDMTLDDVLWSETSDFRELLLGQSGYFNGRLAKVYGVELPAAAPFAKRTFRASQRSGVLTHPYLLATYAYSDSSSPIHRGVFVARGLLGVPLLPPPEAFTPIPEKLHPDMTTRERVMLQTKPESCQSCHAVINSLGFTLENFDAIGRWRDMEKGKRIDVSGSYETQAGDTKNFANATELAKFLANSEEVHASFAEGLFHHLAKQPVRAYGADRLEHLRNHFAKSGFNMRALAVESATIFARAERPQSKVPD